MTNVAKDTGQRLTIGNTVPLTWYDSDNYDEIKTIMSDGRAFAPTYEQWERCAVTVEAFFAAKGIASIRVHVNPHEFGQWCMAQRRMPDAKGRLAFSEWAANSRPSNEGQP